MRGAQGYAYILTHPGVPCVFYDHVWSSGMRNPSRWRRMKKLLVRHNMIDGSSTSPLQPLQDCIVNLIALRRRLGINATSQVSDVFVWVQVWACTSVTMQGCVWVCVCPGASVHGCAVLVGRHSKLCRCHEDA